MPRGTLGPHSRRCSAAQLGARALTSPLLRPCSSLQPSGDFTIESSVAKCGGTRRSLGSEGYQFPSAGCGRLRVTAQAQGAQLPSSHLVSGFPATHCLCLCQPLASWRALADIPPGHEPPSPDDASCSPAGLLLASAPHSFFSSQHPDPLHFYPWVLQNHLLGHCLHSECPFSVGSVHSGSV